MKKKHCASKTRRCIKRYSLPVNMRKWLILLTITQSFGKDKDGFLLRFGGVRKMAISQDFRCQRDDLVSKEYASKHGLQARGWKLALKDALETLDRYWAAQQALWKKAIRRSKLPDTHKTYLNQITASYEKLTNFLAYDAPPNLGKLSESEHKRCTRFLHKVLRRTIKKQPRVKIKRSFLAEPETYRVLEHKGRQYIALTTLTPKKRLLLPLCGQGKISGQVRVVLDFAKRRVEIHHSVPLGVQAKADNPKIAIDLGISEVFTDSQGDRFGTAFGPTLQKISEQQVNKGRKRNRLLAVSEKACENSDHAKARRIKKHNLGHKKQERKASKHRTRIAQIINQSLNTVLTTKSPCAIVYEDLSHMSGKAHSKKLSRLVSYWARSIVRERLDFKTSHRGSVLRACLKIALAANLDAS